MSLVSLIVILIVVGLLLWAITQLPLDPMITHIIRILIVLFVILWLLQAFGLLDAQL
jgi:hypothetical protein